MIIFICLFPFTSNKQLRVAACLCKALVTFLLIEMQRTRSSRSDVSLRLSLDSVSGFPDQWSPPQMMDSSPLAAFTGDPPLVIKT